MTTISWDERNSIVYSWAFTSTPYPIFSVFAVYLWIVYKAGPKFMEDRQPYNLTLVTRLYNIYQLVACLYFILAAFECGFSLKQTWKCFDEPKYSGFVDETSMKIVYYQWWYILLRLSEFLETIFFILRKKFSQVTILHVYHHISVPFLIWTSILYSGGRMETHIAFVNSLVHVLMYGYYFLSSFKLQKFTNLVKPFITAIQIIQLFVLFIHSVVAILPGCHASRLLILHALNLGFLIFMFLKFYVQVYLKNENAIVSSKSQ